MRESARVQNTRYEPHSYNTVRWMIYFVGFLFWFQVATTEDTTDSETYVQTRLLLPQETWTETDFTHSGECLQEKSINPWMNSRADEDSGLQKSHCPHWIEWIEWEDEHENCIINWIHWTGVCEITFVVECVQWDNQRNRTFVTITCV